MENTLTVGWDPAPSVIKSLRAWMKQAPEVFGDSSLQHGALRFDLFSFSYPRLKCSLTTCPRRPDLLRRCARWRQSSICKERTIARNHLLGGHPRMAVAMCQRPVRMNVSDLKRGIGKFVSGMGAMRRGTGHGDRADP